MSAHHNKATTCGKSDASRRKQKPISLSAFHAQLEKAQSKANKNKASSSPATASPPAPISALAGPPALTAVPASNATVKTDKESNVKSLSNGYHKINKIPIGNSTTKSKAVTADSLRGARRGLCYSSQRVRSCPRLPTPTRDVPHELQTVDRMTSSDFRHDFAAHLENMRTWQKNQDHMRFFQLAMHENRHLFAGKTILNLTCGTGTLALMAARAGAKTVFAVDHSQVTDYARLVVKANKMQHIVKVLHGRVEDVKLPQRVDGIVCNWMGQCLLYESELMQLIQARDRWLKPDGFILPDLGALYLLAGAEQLLKNERCNWWLDVYGFNMNAMRRYALAEPRFVRTKGEHLLTLAHKVLSLDLRTASREDFQIDREIRLKVQKEGYCECFVLYFDVSFSRAHLPLKLSCNPCLNSPLKSLWHQTLLFVEQPFIMRTSSIYTGHLTFRPWPNLQRMKISIELVGSTADGIQWKPLVRKSWHLTSRFQTVEEVAQCQDLLN
ncbi:protein arginine N-methyltransferase 1 [Drosophila mojavensis]|uniref:protein arginine N-methyltransferase 1 n=1 Tax=Drosophila mojavensis TaxID=7230 RepID=UPI0013EE635B|nr:protein arginine N-methyltransferase 1 [Drosophila mojavensis]